MWWWKQNCATCPKKYPFDDLHGCTCVPHQFLILSYSLSDDGFPLSCPLSRLLFFHRGIVSQRFLVECKVSAFEWICCRCIVYVGPFRVTCKKTEPEGETMKILFEFMFLCILLCWYCVYLIESHLSHTKCVELATVRQTKCDTTFQRSFNVRKWDCHTDHVHQLPVSGVRPDKSHTFVSIQWKHCSWHYTV